MNYNKVMLGGNITRDPELKQLPSGSAVCNFGIAVNKKWKDANGAAKEEVYFGECQAWGKTGENIAKFFAKGNAIFVEGELRLEQWEKDGVKQSKTRINVLFFQFVDSKGEKNAAPLATAKYGTPAMQTPRQPTRQEVEADDLEIPF